MQSVIFNQLDTPSGPLVTPVIHVLDVAQAVRNIDITFASGCPGAFLINHDFDLVTFLPILKEIRSKRPDFWLGVNFLAQPGQVAFPILAALSREGYEFQAYWADDARIDERLGVQTEAEDIARIRDASGWSGLYIGGVAFKKQRPVSPEKYVLAAQAAKSFMDVICTSGEATGVAIDLAKVRQFRKALGDVPLGLASGVTPDNVTEYVGLVDLVLVATGINISGDFYNIDPNKLNTLLAVIQKQKEQLHDMF